MVAEIISVGTELLMGQIVNTDAQYLAAKLSELGIDMYFQSVVGDNPNRLKQILSMALERSDIIITSGGLGPTADDLTKETIADLLGLDMVRDPYTEQKLKDMFAKVNSKLSSNNFRQADFPRGCIIIENHRGTAPGCIVEHKGKSIIVLPGPPIELTYMFDQQIMPYLAQKSDATISSTILRIFGRGESLVEDTIKDIIAKQTNPTIAPYAGLCDVTLRITAKCKKGEDPNALIKPVEDQIRERLGEYIYATGDLQLENVVAKLLLEKKKKIAVAESCTGGMLSSALVSNPGISAVFTEGVVAYSNEAKIARLRVSPATLEQYGAVSEETAIEMAKGLLVGGVDITAATTGIAGPDGGSPEKPVGLLYVAVATREKTYTKKITTFGVRTKIRTAATLHALNLLRIALLEM
ncbi:MAG: competence/damage-inducible protein A [Christensenellales bacterium]